jgi:tetratricopeptide (TPR) repeat protein
MNAGDAHMEHGDLEAATAAYGDALALAPEVYEIAFWSGITLASNGRADEALPLLGRAYSGEPRLRELVRRLPACGLLPDDEALIARLAEAEAVSVTGSVTGSASGSASGPASSPPSGAAGDAATDAANDAANDNGGSHQDR